MKIGPSRSRGGGAVSEAVAGARKFKPREKRFTSDEIKKFIEEVPFVYLFAELLTIMMATRFCDSIVGNN